MNCHNLRAFSCILLCTAMLTVGCSAVQTVPDNLEQPLHTPENTLTPGVKYPIDVFDPLEGLNRRVYTFNYYFDKFVWLPAVNAYDFVTPDYVQARLGNFVDNVFEFTNFTNNLLQGKFARTGVTTARFAINTTIGVLGLWDPATRFGLERHEEDFGQTLGHYGVGGGPYLVLPIFGPSNLRDTTGLVTDTYAFTQVGPAAWLDDNGTYLIFTVAAAVIERRRETFRYYGTGSPFEYATVRQLYKAKRELQIAR